MALHKVNKKWNTTNLLSNGKEIKFRPFTVGEQKNIILVRQTKKKDAHVWKAIMDLVQECVEGIKIKDMYSVDFERLFYDIRSVSDGETIELDLPCSGKSKDDDGKEIKCDCKIPATLNINDDLELSNKTNFIKKIKLIEDGIVLTSSKGNETNKPETHKEAIDFIDSLSTKYMKDISKFFQNAPAIISNKEYVCPSCDTKNKLTDKDIKGFLS